MRTLFETNSRDDLIGEKLIDEVSSNMAKAFIERKERPRVYGDEIELANLRQRDYPCGCHWIKHFGFIPHMDCKKHQYIAQTYIAKGNT